MEIAFETDRGKVRPLNEDNGSILFDQEEDLLFAVVADGMGGHQAGEVASEMLVTSLREAWEKDKKNLVETKQFGSWLREQIAKSNLEIYNHANSHQECRGMGTTVVAVICYESTVVIAHVGDSRCYFLTGNEIYLKTNDHTLVNELVKAGQITKEEAEFHPRKHVIMRAVGTEPNTEVDIKEMNWNEDDYLLLCSDGLSDKVANNLIQEVLLREISLTEKAKEFINLAIEAGGEDNITLAIVHHTSPEKAGEVE